MERFEPDSTDRLIVEALKVDARASMKALAGKTGLARTTLRDRLRKLEQVGYICGYRVDIARERSSRVRTFLFVKLQKNPAYDVVKTVERFDSVRRCYSLSGEIDLIVEVDADNADDVMSIRNAILKSQNVSTVTTAMSLECHFDRIDDSF